MNLPGAIIEQELLSVLFFSLYIADISVKVMGICGSILSFNYKDIRSGIYFELENHTKHIFFFIKMIYYLGNS